MKEAGGFNKKYILFGVIVAVIIAAILFFSGVFNHQNESHGSSGMPGCTTEPGEWVPQQGECPGTTSDLQTKCNDFCSKHPDCCPGWGANYTGSGSGPGQTLLPLPSDQEVASLTRNYVATIKAIDEGPLIYSTSGQQKIISDDTLDKMKDTGFNTVQILMIGKWDGNKIVLNDENNAVLLNDIVAIKKKGMAVWVALDAGGGSPGSKSLADSYEIYKNAFLNFVNASSALMEKYKVEYLTVNNEEDMFFNLQANWGSASDINKDLIDFYPATNEIARKNFNGKLINKMTQPKKRTDDFLAVTFKNIDIAGVDVGPPVDESMPLAQYKLEMGDYQFYATKAAAAGIPWMNSEYWTNNFGESSQYQKDNQFEYVNAAFDAYLNAIPKGVGFTYNEFATFSWQPDGEKTRLAMKDFLPKI